MIRSLASCVCLALASIAHAQMTDAQALAAADDYIATHRQGEITLKLEDVQPGDKVHAKLARLAFDIGGNASGATNVLMATNAAQDSDPQKFQAFVAKHFNTLVPSNSGKWSNNEAVRGTVTLEYVDAIIAFAKQHNMHVRMHNLIWDHAQQPEWATALLDKALAGDVAAKTELRKAISDRIKYYVADRASGYSQLDVLNESVHKPKYVELFGIEGIASIYKECAEAIRASGAKAITFENEYNVLQYSQKPGGENDPLANWFRERIEALNKAGAEVGGIGVQYYADPRPEVRDPHSPARIRATLGNLAATGLPIVITEFGIKKGGDDAANIRILDEMLRLSFGTPGVEGFLFFGFWEKAMWDQAPAAMIVDKDFKLTPLGEAFARRIGSWHTELDASVNEKNEIRFNGFYGDYDITDANGKTVRVTALRPR